MSDLKANYQALLNHVIELGQQAEELPSDTQIQLNKVFSENPELRVAVDKLVAQVPTESVLAASQATEKVGLKPPSEIIGLVFDFDETLTQANTATPFMEKMGMSKELMRQWDAEEEARGTHSGRRPQNWTMRYINSLPPGEGITRQDFKDYAATVPLAAGLTGENNFFDRMRAYAKDQGVEVQFHMASANFYDIPANSAIALEFNTINAKRLIFDEQSGLLTGMGQSVDFTTKTRMLTEISKGIVDKNATDGLLVNRKLPTVIPLKNMVIVGDGETDMTFMAMARDHGGTAIGVYNPEKPTRNLKVLQDDHAADELQVRDYREGSPLEAAFKEQIRAMAERIRNEKEIYSQTAQEQAASVGKPVEVTTTNPKELLAQLVDLGREARRDPEAAESKLDAIFAARPDLKEACDRFFKRMEVQPAILDQDEVGKLVPPSRRVALVFDFDETVTEGNSIRTFYKAVGITDEEREQAGNKVKAEGVHASQVGERVNGMLFPTHGVTKAKLEEFGATIPFSKGLLGEDNFFDRMREFAKEKGLEIEFHIASANLTDMIKATSLAKEMDSVMGMRLTYDEQTGMVNGCAESANFTVKTRMVDLVRKGLTHADDDTLVNRHMPDFIPIKNMIAVADGKTDIAYMAYTKQHGGSAIGVYDANGPETEIMSILKQDQRVDYLLPRDYSRGTELETAFKSVITQVADRVREEDQAYDKRVTAKTGAGLVMPSEAASSGESAKRAGV